MADLEVVQAWRVLRYVGDRVSIEKTLDRSLKGTTMVGGSAGKGWMPDSPFLTIHAEELGRPEVAAVRLDYAETYPVMVAALGAARSHLPADRADDVIKFLNERGYGLVKLRG